MKAKTFGAIIGTLMAVLIVGCDMLGDAININANANVDVETTSELGQNTLDRIDDINDTLGSGVEVGPETRETIEELNETIANGIKAGFDDDTLARVDELLRVVEDGLKIGLDDETLNTIDGMVNTIDEMPGNWEASAQDIIQTLENTGGSMAKTLADEVTRVMEEARVNYQQMTAITGIEFRCNVDFMGSKVGASVSEFIGKSIVGKLREIISGKEEEEAIPTPWVCQVIPDSMTLSQVGEHLVFEDGIVTLTGYNYVAANTPSAHIIDETGNIVSGIALYPYLSSPYQVQLNLQDLDLSAVPARSRLVFTWPNISETSGIAILLPGHAGPVASFTSDVSFGNAPLTVHFSDTSIGDPVEWEWQFGDGSLSHDQNPTKEFTDSRDYQVQLTVKNSQGQSSVINVISVGTKLEAKFSFSPSSIDAASSVKFKDQSEGSPESWEWNFGDGSGTSTEQNPEYLYNIPNPNGYEISLTVRRGNETSTYTSPDRVKVFEELNADFSADVLSGKPPFTVKFKDLSTGGSSIAGWRWDFGDGTPVSTEQNPVHTYSTKGLFDVKLTITRNDGKQDVEPKENYINAWTIQRLVIPRFNMLSNNSVYFTSFAVTGGTPKDTGISTSKYICAINGFNATGGIVLSNRMTRDGLRIYLDKQQTWKIVADYQDIDHSKYRNEVWTVSLICFQTSVQGDYILYRDDFNNINGGDPKNTGISTEDYFHCGVAGTAGLGATGFIPGAYFPVLIQQVVYPDGNDWKIGSDMDVTNGGDVWNTDILCLKDGDYLNVEKPMFLAERGISFQTSLGTVKTTNISANDYLCGISGYTAEKGDYNAYVDNPLFPVPQNAMNPMLKVQAVVKDGYWVVEADIASKNDLEDWTVDMLCVKKGVAVQGIPPN